MLVVYGQTSCQTEAKQYSLLWPVNEVVEQVIRPIFHWVLTLTRPDHNNDMDESLSKGQLDHLLCTPRKPGSEGEG